MRGALFSTALVAAALVAQAGFAEAPIGQTVRAIEIVQASKDTQQRKLVSNDPVYQSELVETGADSYAGITLNDNTSLAIGPNSNVLLDEFIYTPGSSAGTAVVTMTKGALRFVSGKLASESYQIRTPTATIGIRGSIVVVLVGLNGQTTMLVQQGIGTVTNLAGQVTVVSTPGQSSTVEPPSGNTTPPPGPPGPPPPGVIALLQALANLQPPPSPPGSPPPDSAGVTIAVVGDVVTINVGPTLAQLTTGGTGNAENGSGGISKEVAGAGLAAAAAAALLLLLNNDGGGGTTTTTTTTTTK